MCRHTPFRSLGVSLHRAQIENVNISPDLLHRYVGYLYSGKVSLRAPEEEEGEADHKSVRIVRMYIEAEMLRDPAFSRLLLRELLDNAVSPDAVDEAYNQASPETVRTYLVHRLLEYVHRRGLGDEWFNQEAENCPSRFVIDVGHELFKRRGEPITVASIVQDFLDEPEEIDNNGENSDHAPQPRRAVRQHSSEDEDEAVSDRSP